MLQLLRTSRRLRQRRTLDQFEVVLPHAPATPLANGRQPLPVDALYDRLGSDADELGDLDGWDPLVLGVRSWVGWGSGRHLRCWNPRASSSLDEGLDLRALQRAILATFRLTNTQIRFVFVPSRPASMIVSWS